MGENLKSRARLTRDLEEAHRRIAALEAASGGDAGANTPAGKEMLHNTSLLRSIAENLPSAYLSIINSDLTIGFTSGQGFEKLGLDARQFISLTLEEVFGDSAALVRENYEQTFAGERRSFELFINDQHQLYRTVPLRDEAGAVSHILAVVEDITDRKRAEEELRRSEARFRLMFEKNSAVMLLIEPGGGQIVDANAAAAEFYGYPRDALTKMSIQDINQLGPDAVARHLNLAENEQMNYFIFQHRLRSGEVRQVEVHSTPIETLGQVHLFSIVHDITSREDAVQQLLQSEEKFRSYIQNAPYGVFIADERGRYLEVNPKASEITGYSEQELLEMTVPDLLPPESQAAGADHFAR